MERTEGRTKTLIILNSAVIIGVIYLLSICLAYPAFQDTWLIDPLAEINSLFPLYYVAIALTALLGLVYLIWRIENKYLHILLLVMFATMLWFTPYSIAGFVRNPDGPWHLGVAMNIPQVLGGEAVAFSDYALAYPGSFLFHYAFLNIIGVEPTSYMSKLFPLFLVLLFVPLCYAVISRIFNEKVAFLSVFIAIPGLHYIVMHPAPYPIGLLLMLTASLLLTRQGAAAKAMAILAVMAIIVSHPLAPLILSIFLAAALLISIGYSRRFGRPQVMLSGMLVFCLLGWFLWFVFYPPWPWGERIDILYHAILPERPAVSGLMGESFIYGNILNIKRGVYILYAAAAILGIFYIAARTYRQDKSVRNWLSKLWGLNPGEAFITLSIPFLLVFTLLSGGIDPALMERGLTFIILALSCIIASVIVRLYHSGISRRAINSVAMVGVLFLTISSPIIAYSIDAYSSFPMSERAGLQFLATEVPLEDKQIAMDWPFQITLYKASGLNQTQFILLSHPKEALDLSEIAPDLIVFRRTGYYVAAMRRDLSFDDNRFTEYRAIAESNEYDKIYSSSTFEIYFEHKE